MPTISTNKELLNVINDDVKNVKQFTQMPAISDELYNELVKEFNKILTIFSTNLYTLED